MMLSERQQKIIRLLEQNKTCMTGEELSKRIGVSSRTIRSDMKAAMSHLEKCGARIESDTRSGYALDIKDADLFKKKMGNIAAAYMVSVEDRESYILHRFLQAALASKTVSQQQLAEELYVSLSTLKTSLKEVSKKLAEYDLEFATYKTEGLRIVGNEAKLRYFISKFFFDKSTETNTLHSFYQKMFSEVDFTTIERIILRVITAFEFRLTDMAVQNLLVHIAIAIKRAEQENYMIYTVSQSKVMEKTREFEIAAAIFEEVFRELQVAVATSEIYYLTQHLMASKKYMDADETPLKQMTEMVMDMIAVIHENVGIDFAKDETLIQWLAIHLKTAIPRMRFQMNIRNDVLEVIKSEYPLAFQIALIAGNYIGKKEEIEVNENEIGYIAIHFGAALSRLDIKNDACIRWVLLVCSTGIGTAVLLRTRLEEHFGNRIRIVDTMPGYAVNQKIVDTVDFVISTIPIKHLTSEKIMQVSHLMNQAELQLLEQKFFSEHKGTAAEVEKFFRRDCFYTEQEFKTKQSILQFLTEQLRVKGLMDEKAKASVFEREETSPTEIGNLVAIPHPIYNDTPVSSVATLILKKPILWEEHHVQIVFLISIANSEFKLWETVFLKLFKYLVKDNGVKEILHEPSYPAFVKNFKKKFSQG